MRSWKEVADNLEVDESVVMKRWGNLRERFYKEIRISQNASGSGAFIGRQWALFESLQFFRSHIIPRPMRQSAPILKRSDENYDFINISSESISQDLSPSPPISPGQLIPSDQSTIILSDQTTAIPSDQSIPSSQISANPSLTSRPRKRRGRQLDEVDTAILGTVKTFQEVCELRARREEFEAEIGGFGRMIGLVRKRSNLVALHICRGNAFVKKTCGNTALRQKFFNACSWQHFGKLSQTLQ
ncbi:uncharacterized protein LOC120781593 [Bactrocera tryoni]|uniref:uncharacterized protein LOC120781593 n=1 Tax=Bactrocera tryoni TaxID=59916 RepID=UPI001A9689DC|nr:uncharacterized protein LOC120781593 [Bactrocera tryoni]